MGHQTHGPTLFNVQMAHTKGKFVYMHTKCKPWLLNSHMAEWFTQEVSQLPLVGLQTRMGLNSQASQKKKKKKKKHKTQNKNKHNSVTYCSHYGLILCKVLTQDRVCLSSSAMPDVSFSFFISIMSMTQDLAM